MHQGPVQRLGALLIGSAALNALAADPPPTLPAQPTTPPPATARTDSPAAEVAPAVKVWSAQELSDQVVQVKSLVTLLDRIYKKNPAASPNDWENSRSQYLQLVSSIDTALTKSPTQGEMDAFGVGLAALNTSLSDRIVELAAGGKAAPSFGAAGVPDGHILLTQDNADFQLAHFGARALLPFMEQTFRANGRTPKAYEQRLMDAAGVMAKSEGPNEMWQGLAPVREQVLTDLAVAAKTGSAPTGMLEPFADLIRGLKNPGAPVGAAVAPPPTDAIGWERTWLSFNKNEVRGLFPDGRAWHEFLAFKESIKTPANFDQVKSDAEMIGKFMDGRQDSQTPDNRQMRGALNRIGVARDPDLIEQNDFKLLQKATLYYKQNSKTK